MLVKNKKVHHIPFIKDSTSFIWASLMSKPITLSKWSANRRVLWPGPHPMSTANEDGDFVDWFIFSLQWYVIIKSIKSLGYVGRNLLYSLAWSSSSNNRNAIFVNWILVKFHVLLSLFTRLLFKSFKLKFWSRKHKRSNSQIHKSAVNIFLDGSLLLCCCCTLLLLHALLLLLFIGTLYNHWRFASKERGSGIEMLSKMYHKKYILPSSPFIWTFEISLLFCLLWLENHVGQQEHALYIFSFDTEHHKSSDKECKRREMGRVLYWA